MGELSDSDLFFAPDVEYSPDSLRMLDQLGEGAHGIAHMAKTARLGAVPKNRQRLSGERRTDEIGEHHAVATRLTRADRIEKPHDNHRQTFFFPVSQCEKFVDCF